MKICKEECQHGFDHVATLFDSVGHLDLCRHCTWQQAIEFESRLVNVNIYFHKDESHIGKAVRSIIKADTLPKSEFID